MLKGWSRRHNDDDTTLLPRDASVRSIEDEMWQHVLYMLVQIMTIVPSLASRTATYIQVHPWDFISQQWRHAADGQVEVNVERSAAPSRYSIWVTNSCDCRACTRAAHWMRPLLTPPNQVTAASDSLLRAVLHSNDTGENYSVKGRRRDDIGQQISNTYNVSYVRYV